MNLPPRLFGLVVIFGLMSISLTVWPSLLAGDWNQWRGPHRNGLLPDSPELLDRLPADGLQPTWKVGEDVIGQGNAGWSSPVVAGSLVYLFSHTRQRRPEVNLPEEKYPKLTPEQREDMPQDLQDEHEANRRREQLARKRKQTLCQERIVCLEAATGKTVWLFERESVLTRFPHSSSPAVVGEHLYQLTAERDLLCLEALTGQQRWRAELPLESPAEDQQWDQTPSSVALSGGVVVVLSQGLCGVDAQTGKVLWQNDQVSNRDSSPAIWQANDRVCVIVNATDGRTVCVDLKTGQLLWGVKTDARRSTPVVVGNILLTYSSSRKSGLMCYDLVADNPSTEPTRRWQFQGIADPGSSPVVWDGHVYVQGQQRLACLDLETGKPQWRTTLDLANPRYTSLVCADGKVIYGFESVLLFAATPQKYSPLAHGYIDEDGLLAEEQTHRKRLNLATLDQRQAERLWQSKVRRQGPKSCTSPALADGRLFLRLNKGLICYDLRK